MKNKCSLEQIESIIVLALDHLNKNVGPHVDALVVHLRLRRPRQTIHRILRSHDLVLGLVLIPIPNQNVEIRNLVRVDFRIDSHPATPRRRSRMGVEAIKMLVRWFRIWINLILRLFRFNSSEIVHFSYNYLSPLFFRQ